MDKSNALRVLVITWAAGENENDRVDHKCRRRINSSASRDWPTRVMFWGLLLLLIMSDHTESNNTLAVNEK